MVARPLLGVDFGGTKIEAAALDSTGAILCHKRAPTPRGDYDSCLRAVRALVEAVEAQVGTASSVGVGIPGSISTADVVKNANSTWLNGRPFHHDLERALGRPISVENDANCLTLSEATDGAAAGADVAFGVILGTGCGGGLSVRGALVAGRNRLAGEWGHNPLPWASPEETPGPPCWCGKSGCIETWVSGTGLEADYLRRGGDAARTVEIVARMRRGEPLARSVFQAHGERLARALAHVVNLIDPDVIVFGGGLSLIDELYEGLAERVAAWVFSDQIATRFVKNRHGDSSGVRGAAWIGAAKG